MVKGKYGIVYSFYATLAFILAFLGQNLMCLLLLGFVIVAEKDEWTTKQVIQAFLLSLIASILNSVLSILNILSGVPILGAIISALISIVTSLISIVILVICIISIAKVLKGRDAQIPGLSRFANWAYGLVAQKVYNDVASPASDAGNQDT